MNKVLALALLVSALSLAIASWTYIAHQVRVCEQIKGGIAVMAPLTPLRVRCVQQMKEIP